MRIHLALATLALAAAGCDETKSRPPAPPVVAGASVTIRGQAVEVAHLTRDPERRYPRGPGTLCSWDRDHYIHFFGLPACDVVFLDASGKVLEVARHESFSEYGVTSKNEARHALLLASRVPGVGDVVGFSEAVASRKADPMPAIKVGGHVVTVETSHTLDQRQRGLMNRPRLSKNDGMLFCYPREDDRSFWMKNTLIALDIAHFDAKGNLLNVCRMKPAADPANEGADLKAPSAAPARFVLEVNYGWFDAHGLIDADGKPSKPVLLEVPDAVRRLADQAE